MNVLLIYPEFPDLHDSPRPMWELLDIKRYGSMGKERWQYWRLLLWTQFRCPRLLPDAVILAIYGYHFRVVCERHVVCATKAEHDTGAGGRRSGRQESERTE